jgi:hypothetical protein
MNWWTDKENVVHIKNGMLFIYKTMRSCQLQFGGSRDQYTKRNKWRTESQVSCDLSLICEI